MTQSSGSPAKHHHEGTMGRIVKVKVRPGGRVRFPGFCVHCSQPAVEVMALSRRSGRRTRSIDVPLCANCFRELRLESGEEERLRRLGRAASVGVSLVVAILAFLLLNALLSFLIALLAAPPLGLIAGLGTRHYSRRKRLEAARPEKKAILASARMVEFSWRAATFEFENEDFSDRFLELNQEKLMEA
ncbi:MAG TPA: hypothetical protein VFI27_14250 [candidate division Zixibacteria bacterium]|nr:hypothetical protein [candidate division Zixibacteria bacterium]